MDFRLSFRKIRALPPPDAGLHILARGTEQAEAFAARLRAKAGPPLAKVYALRRRLATAAVGFFALWLFVHVMLGANGMVVYRTKRTMRVREKLFTSRLNLARLSNTRPTPQTSDRSFNLL